MTEKNKALDIDKELEDLIGFSISDHIEVELDHQDDFEFARHANSGCTTHANSGCTTHADYSQNTHSNTGYSNHSDHVDNYSNWTNKGCNTHSNSGYNNHSDYTNYYYERGNAHTNSGYNNWSNSYYNNWSNCAVGGCGHGCKTSGSGCRTHTDCSNTHSNYYEHLQSNYGCKDHKNTGYSDHTNSGCYTHSQSGCSTHTNSGCNAHNNSGYSNHANDGYNNHTNYTDNNPPTMSGVVSPPANTFNNSIPLSWSAAADTIIPGQPGQPAIIYNIHYRHKASGASSFGAQQFLATSGTATSYTWNTTNVPNGTVIVYVFAYDGIEWSGGFDANSNPTGSYAMSAELKIVHYAAPSWTNVITDGSSTLKKIDHDELRREINKARESFGLAKKSFTGGETVAVDTVILATHMSEMLSAGNEAAAAAKKPQISFSESAGQNATIQGTSTRELRTLLETFDD